MFSTHRYVLLALRKLIQKYEYKTEPADRAPLDDIVAATFPMLRGLFTMLLRDHNQGRTACARF